MRQSSAEACKKRRTFGDCAAKLIAAKRASWRSQKHAEQWMTSLDRPCVLIKERSVAEIDTAAVLEVLQPLWIRTPETALRLRGRIEAVLDYAKAQGWRTGENCARWNGHLENILARRPKLAQSHHAAMPYGEVPQFMQELRGREAFASTALQFLILTTTRLSEVTGATWAEMDLEAAKPFVRWCPMSLCMAFVLRFVIGVPRLRISRVRFASKPWAIRSATRPSSLISVRIGLKSVGD